MPLLRSSFHSIACLHRTQQHPPCACAVIPAILCPPPQSLHQGCSGIKGGVCSAVLSACAFFFFHSGIRLHPPTPTVYTYFSGNSANFSLLARGHRLSALSGLRAWTPETLYYLLTTADPKLIRRFVQIYGCSCCRLFGVRILVFFLCYLC